MFQSKFLAASLAGLCLSPAMAAVIVKPSGVKGPTPAPTLWNVDSMHLYVGPPTKDMDEYDAKDPKATAIVEKLSFAVSSTVEREHPNVNNFTCEVRINEKDITGDSGAPFPVNCTGDAVEVKLNQLNPLRSGQDHGRFSVGVAAEQNFPLQGTWMVTDVFDSTYFNCTNGGHVPFTCDINTGVRGYVVSDSHIGHGVLPGINKPGVAAGKQVAKPSAAPTA